MKHIEEISLNAWPSLQQILYDGWVLRFSNGYTRRANSINPVYPGKLATKEKIARCEAIYAARQMPPVFKMTPFSQPAELDEALAQAGYQSDARTSVQTLDLAGLSTESVPASSQQWATPTDDWVSSFVTMNSVSATNTSTLRQILHNIAPACCFAMVLHNQEPVACGLGVLDGHYVGLFDIVTNPAYRKQGFATQLVTHILQWAKDKQAQTAYLQVMLNNEAALNLYAKLGFQEVYQYWYRVAR